jgi:hypothetical protein
VERRVQGFGEETFKERDRLGHPRIDMMMMMMIIIIIRLIFRK